MLIPFNRQQQLLKSFYPSMSPRGIPLRNINLPLLPPPLLFCPVKSQSPWEAGSGCREEDHISRQKPDPLSERRHPPNRALPFITGNLFFCLLPVSHLRTDEPPRWSRLLTRRGQRTVSDLSSLELYCLCAWLHNEYMPPKLPLPRPFRLGNDTFCWQCGQKKKRNLLHYAKVCKVTRALFEFHTNIKRGVEQPVIATASAHCWFTKVWINCIFSDEEQGAQEFTFWDPSTLQQSHFCLSQQTMDSSWDCLEKSDNLSRFKTLLNAQHGCCWLRRRFLCEITRRG